jgi:hypothetical protein
MVDMDAYSARHRVVATRSSGITFRARTPHNGLKLTCTEEQTHLQHMLSLDLPGLVSRLYEVADMADELLGARGGTQVTKNCAERYVICSLRSIQSIKGFSWDTKRGFGDS